MMWAFWKHLKRRSESPGYTIGMRSVPNTDCIPSSEYLVRANLIPDMRKDVGSCFLETETGWIKLLVLIKLKKANFFINSQILVGRITLLSLMLARVLL